MGDQRLSQVFNNQNSSIFVIPKWLDIDLDLYSNANQFFCFFQDFSSMEIESLNLALTLYARFYFTVQVCIDLSVELDHYSLNLSDGIYDGELLVDDFSFILVFNTNSFDYSNYLLDGCLTFMLHRLFD